MRRILPGQGSRKKSDGTVRLSVSNAGGEGQTPPSPEQAAAYRDLIVHQGIIRDAILQAIFHEYPEYRASYIADYDLEESDDTVPVLDRPEQLRDLIGLSSLLIHPVVRDGVAYVGYQFGCAWEEEHGLGAMMHRNRVVKVGHADAGILEWIAERDARPRYDGAAYIRRWEVYQGLGESEKARQAAQSGKPVLELDIM